MNWNRVFISGFLVWLIQLTVTDSLMINTVRPDFIGILIMYWAVKYGRFLGTVSGMIFGLIIDLPLDLSITISLSMLCVIIVAALIGTSIPIILDKRGIDPAIATGPFITTGNDVIGILLFFYVAKIILGF